MRLLFFFILIPVVWMTGCDTPAPESLGPSVEGVTLADLRPDVMEKPMPVMLFLVTTYLVDAAYAEEMQSCYIVAGGAIRFWDKKAFEENGFLAARGTGMQAGLVNACLVRLGAQRLGQTTLMLDAGTEVPFSETGVGQEQTVSYRTAGGGTAAVSLQNGRLGWHLTAQPNRDLSGQVSVQVVPVFVPQGIRNWPGAEEYVQKMAHRFNECRFDVSLREADFVLLSLKHDPEEELTAFQRLLFGQPGGKPQMRLYVISCVKAEG